MARAERDDEHPDRYLVVDGRRWRRSDPAIPEALRDRLVRVLMHGRRSVGQAQRSSDDDGIAAARRQVHDAKLALGERGEPWWEAPSDDGLEARIAATLRTLLRCRDGSTTRASEAARVVGGDDWRPVLDRVRGVVADLAEDGVVEVHLRARSTDAEPTVRLTRGRRFDVVDPTTPSAEAHPATR